MGGNIFLVGDDEQVVQLTETQYESEELFQRLIEQYPNILAGDQISAEPRKWIFVSRELGIPDHTSGNSQWFLDHLFLDQDATPTFVEVKRSTDTRIRREVVAQMLDYAANAVAYWPVEQLRSLYENNRKERDRPPLEEIDVPPEGVEDYWNRVEANLRAGKIRLLFVADEIPDSLRRIIEFLNEQMRDTEVLGLEIKQFLSDTQHRILVPKVVGNTMAAIQEKKRRGVVSWDKDSYLERVERISGPKIAAVCCRLLEEFTRMGCWIYWGTGQKQAGFVPIYQGKVKHQLAAVYSYETGTTIEIYLQHLKAPFRTEEKQRELIQAFSKALDIQILAERIFKRPSFDCEILTDDKKFDQYIKTYEDILTAIRDHEAQN